MNILMKQALLSQIQDYYKVTGNHYVIKELEELKNYLEFTDGETAYLKDKLSHHNLQIKDLKKKIKIVKLETLKGCRCLLGSVSPEKAARGLDLDIVELSNFIYPSQRR